MKITSKMKVLCLSIIIMLFLSGCVDDTEKKYNEAKKAADQAAQVAQAAEEEYDKLLRYIAKYEELQAKLERLTPGTREYEKVRKENNELVRKMKRDFPDLMIEMKP